MEMRLRFRGTFIRERADYNIRVLAVVYDDGNEDLIKELTVRVFIFCSLDNTHVVGLLRIPPPMQPSSTYLKGDPKYVSIFR